MAEADGSRTAADVRSEAEASTSEEQLEQDVNEFVKLQTEFLRQLDEVGDKPLRVRQVQVV